MPRLSICVPTYNRASVIAESLATILGQTYNDFELVVVDNASTDCTRDVVLSIRDPRLRYVCNSSNIGIIENHNRCIAEAKGDLVAIYHDHDLYDCDLVRQSVELLDEQPRVGVVCCAVHHVDGANPERIAFTDIQRWSRVTDGRILRRELLHRWSSPVMSPTAMVRRICYERCGGGYRPEFGSGGDRELWMRILGDWDLGYLREPLARLRLHGKRGQYGVAEAGQLWSALKGHAAIQRVYCEKDFGHAPGRLWLEYRRIRAKQRREYWRTALWAVAKKHDEVCRQGMEAFQEADMKLSAAALDRLRMWPVGGEIIENSVRLVKWLKA